MNHTITLNADTADRIQALAAVKKEDPQATFDTMLEKGLAVFTEERQGIDIRVKGYAAERIERLAAIYECSNNTMADRLLQAGIRFFDIEDGAL